MSEFCTEFSIAEVSTQVATQVATQVSTQLSITCADTLSWGLQQGSIWNWNWSEVHFRPWMQWSGRRGAFRTSNFHQLPIIFAKLLFCSWFYQNYEMHLSPCPVQKGRKKSPWHFATCIKRLCSTTMAIFNLLFEILCIILSWMGIYKLPLFLSFFPFLMKTVRHQKSHKT